MRCSTRAFSSTALLYWWSVFGVGPQRHGGSAMASLFTTMVHTGALGALLTLSPVRLVSELCRPRRSRSDSTSSKISSSAAS